MRTPATVLGIETSCDETGAGVVADGVLLGQCLASSMDLHARFGGIVPEVAARAHLQALTPVVDGALRAAGRSLRDIDAVAVTTGPGLAPALTIGVAAAKAYALSLDVPLYAVHHPAAHAAADTLEHGPLPGNAAVLIVSGGHTSLLQVPDLAREPIRHLADTTDDAAGEAFDKVARLLALPYPGGPHLDRLARHGDPAAIAFPRPLTRPGEVGRGFSFSGLKTAVARWVETHHPSGLPVADVAASFQEAIVDVLTTKALAACRDHGADTLVIVGGVAANTRLRDLAEHRCATAGVQLRIPTPALCTDNGAMVAALGDLLHRAGARPSPLDAAVDPSAPLTRAVLESR